MKNKTKTITKFSYYNIIIGFNSIFLQSIKGRKKRKNKIREKREDEEEEEEGKT